MRLHWLDLTAFGPFGGAQSVDFDDLSAAGLFLLHGPTGAGKTSVLDAVCYALYGSVPGARQTVQGQGLTLRSDHAAPGVRTEVTLELTVAGRRLEITRQPPHERAKKRGTGTTVEKAQTWLREYDPVGAVWKDLSRSHQEIGEEITQLLGMSREQFCQVVLLPQGDFARFLRADAEARGRLLGRLFDTRRFADVEKRLAERRREAEARVREGDAELVADAHRMQQAAGDAMELPELQPGEPGLAEAVAGAAAVARSTAREQLTIARCGLAAAESAQASAERALTDARELARLQRRFAEARERAERLEERAGAHREDQVRMERSRKAEAVAPALELREAAETEHRAAARAEAHARALLRTAVVDHAGHEGGLDGGDGGGRDGGGSGGRDAGHGGGLDRGHSGGRDGGHSDGGRDGGHSGGGRDGGGSGGRDAGHGGGLDGGHSGGLDGGHSGGRDGGSSAGREAGGSVGLAEASGVGLAEASGAGLAEASGAGLAEASGAGLAEASGAGLAAAARRAAEELGGLESARRAERRLADLLAERTGLDRQERADADVLQEAESWLAGWEETRTGLLGAVESAQEAATRAERLAVQREPARERLAAARRRDRLVRDADDARRHLLTATEHAQRARAAWLDVKERRLNGIAAELAARLSAGEPCAVCGAVDHPAPARKDAGHVGRETEEQALAVFQRADEERAEAAQRLSLVERELATAAGEAGDSSTEELAAVADTLEREYTRARSGASTLHTAHERLRQAEQERDRRVSAQQEAAVRSASRVARRDALDRERATLEAELAQARGTADSVADRAAQLERRVALLTDAADAARAAEDTAQRLKDADARLADAAFRAGFDTPQAAADALLDPAAHRELQRRLDARQSEEATVRAVLAEADTAAAAQQPPADLATAQDTAALAARRLRDAASARDAAARRCTELDRLSARTAEGVRRLAPLREEYDRVARMAGLTAGTSADNERKMRLEAYVLAARLEQVAAAATARLQRMSAGRYTLVHSDDRAGRGRSGLGLRVVDAWTGRERDTATLSGGETFFASLALALGLADVVTDEAGGVRLDTLFIDEGFGSLDDQTLDEVLDVLDSLRERDRSVGIVSHVADLRRRVHAQLEVVKGRSGSVVRQRGYRPSGRRGSGEE
ncbi:AAA family ATPase [Streptomyces sp. NBC_00582]|uniref:AAA family ATPase n=1 Tax=Streptomyces sp. NBC_00582 TaxID=2975783 RepID=UPI002E822196|nr:AAA family ATPase [Streptomyces sp. NBC_00582]WUB66247.1 AAA family ATPase [Streptomyces sp. NBC_00582]